MIWTVYNSYGEIIRIVDGPNGYIDAIIAENERYVIGGFSWESYYVRDGMPEPRPTMSPVVNGTTIGNLPAGCRVRVEKEAVIVDDGVLELSFDYPGTYPVKLSCFPYLDATVEVTL